MIPLFFFNPGLPSSEVTELICRVPLILFSQHLSICTNSPVSVFGTVLNSFFQISSNIMLIYKPFCYNNILQNK
jgi:hypothetical protein